MKENVTIYFDEDGVLAKWNEFASQEEVASPGYFLNCELQKNIRDLIVKLQLAGNDVKILTAYYPDGSAMEEKRIWTKDIAGLNIDIVFVPYGANKFDYVPNKGRKNILVDDFKGNLVAWRENGYTAVKFMNNVNSRPRLKVAEDGSMQIIADSWDGISIDRRQSVDDMYAVITGVINSVAA